MTNDRTIPPAKGGRSPHQPATPMPWLLRRVNQRYRDAVTARLAEAGFGDLPRPGYWALAALAGGSGDASQLVGEMGTSKQAVSKLVDALVAAGFVDRRVNEADRRRTDLLLTERGQKAVGVIAEAVRTTEERFAAVLGAGSLAELALMLEQLAREEA
jgi:DNA-binding MarR family transcriptional regulator